MTHIEFLGAPGVGKSTIYSELINSDKIYGGVEDDAIRRILLEKTEYKYQIPYQFLPSDISQFFEEELIKYRLNHNTFDEFVQEYPEFIDELSVAMNSVAYEPGKIFSYCKESAVKYQIGMSTVQDGETLCLDESFTQRVLAILRRCRETSFSLEAYFDVVPTPDIVVHVTAPWDVCLERQRKRGRVVVGKNWEKGNPKQGQKRSQMYCSRIQDNLPNKTSVVTVENTNSVEAAIDEVCQNLQTKITDI